MVAEIPILFYLIPFYNIQDIIAMFSPLHTVIENNAKKYIM